MQVETDNSARRHETMLKRINLYLVKPSQYDDDGYVVRHWRGVLPSNTLACLAGLTEEVMEQKRLGESLEVKVHLLDEAVDYIPVKKICKSQRGSDTKTIVCLGGSADEPVSAGERSGAGIPARGIDGMIGGFHVSGYLALLKDIPADIQSLMDAGVTIVKGEVEEIVGRAADRRGGGTLKPLYDYIDKKPDLYEKPMPMIQDAVLAEIRGSEFRDAGLRARMSV